MSRVTQLDNQTSFETVIDATQELLHQIETQVLDSTAIESDIVHLLKLDKGPRGFFASFLTDARPLADHPPESVLAAFRAVPQVTAALLVKNLAMSTAMVLHHQRQADHKAIAGSQQVQQRSQHLLQALKLPEMTAELKALQQSVEQSGPYSDFLKRWNYDPEQKTAIANVVSTILENSD